MSLLTTFLQKPYTGLAQTSQNFINFAPVNGRPQLQLEATDTTAGAETFPNYILKTNRNVVGAGGSIYWQALNSTPANINIAQINANINTLAAGAESSQFDFSVYSAGAIKKVSLRGDLNALVPGVDAQWGLGTAAFNWSGIYLGDATRKGSLLPDAAEGLLVGTDSAHAMALKTNGVVRVRIGNAGRLAVNDTISAATMVHLGGNHVGNATTLYAYDSTITFPATTTVAAYGVAITMATAAAAFVLPSLVGVQVFDAVAGAGSTITAFTGFRVDSAGASAASTIGFTANVPSNGSGGGSTSLSFNAPGTAPSYFAKNILIGNVGLGFPFNGLLYLVDTGTQAASAWLARTGALAGNTVLQVTATTAAGYPNIFLAQLWGNPGAIYVRGDGSLIVSNVGSNAVVDSAFVTIGGRISIAADQTYNLVGNTIASTIYLSNAITVNNGLVNNVIELVPSAITLNGTGVLSAYVAYLVATATGAATQMTGFSASLRNPGAGATYGGVFDVGGLAGNTGTLVGAQINITPVATSVATAGVNVYVGSTLVTLNYGFRVIGTPGALVTNAFFVDPTVLVSGAAYQYNQRAGAAGGFLTFLDSTAATRFQVDVNGDMTLGGTSRRIKGDFNNATPALRTLFMNANAALGTLVGAVPSAGGVIGGFVGYGNPDPTNSAYLQMSHDGATAATLLSTAVGTGTIYPLRAQVGANVPCLSAEINGDIRLGATSGITTGSTFGFPYIISGAGAPTGVPTVRAGATPMYYDTTTHKLWMYDTAWKGVVLV